MIRSLVVARTLWLEMWRRKEVYVLLILMACLALALLAVDVHGIGGITVFVKEIGFMFAWLLAWILAVAASVRQLPAEEKDGTIYTLLAKPISRWELLFGKWLGSWTVVSFATICFYGMIAAVSILRGGTCRWETFLQGYLLHTAALAVMCAIALAASTRMHLDAALTFTYTATAAVSFIVPRVPQWAGYAEGWRRTALEILFYVLPHFELFNLRQRLVMNGDPVAWWVAGWIIAYGAIVTALFLLLAWIGYRRKRFLRGETG